MFYGSAIFLCVLVFPAVYSNENICRFPNHWCQDFTTADKCSVTRQCESYVWNQASGPVNVELYYESMCQACKAFVSKMLYPTWKKLHSIMNVTLIPYGNAEEYQRGHRWIFKCQHGPNECEGNQIETCAIAILEKTQVWMPYIACMESSTALPLTAAKACASRLSVNYTHIDRCAHNEWGDMLQHHMAVATDALRPQHDFVPWIVVNGVHTDKIQNEAEDNLTKLVCDTYQGPKPGGCAKVSRERCQKNRQY